MLNKLLHNRSKICKKLLFHPRELLLYLSCECDVNKDKHAEFHSLHCHKLVVKGDKLSKYTMWLLL